MNHKENFAESLVKFPKTVSQAYGPVVRFACKPIWITNHKQKAYLNLWTFSSFIV